MAAPRLEIRSVHSEKPTNLYQWRIHRHSSVAIRDLTGDIGKAAV